MDQVPVPILIFIQIKEVNMLAHIIKLHCLKTNLIM